MLKDNSIFYLFILLQTTKFNEGDQQKICYNSKPKAVLYKLCKYIFIFFGTCFNFIISKKAQTLHNN